MREQYKTTNSLWPFMVYPYLLNLRNFLVWPHHDKEPKGVAFADDLICAANIVKLRSLWAKFLEIGSKFGYFPKPTKTVLLVKPNIYFWRYTLKKYFAIQASK